MAFRGKVVRQAAKLGALCIGGAYTISMYEESLRPQEEGPLPQKDANAFRLKRRLPSVWRPADCEAMSVESRRILTTKDDRDFNSIYKLGKKLGVGAYAVVHECTNKTNGVSGAVKVFDRKHMSHRSELAIREEVTIMRELRHPAIVRVLDWLEDRLCIYIVMELCRGGELFDRIVEKHSYNEKEARDVLRTVLDALVYCHERGIVHRDLKPENLLLESKDDDSAIKIADFGIAGRVRGKKSLDRHCGTPGYTAPEIIEGKTYDEKCDLWSLGVIAFILLGGYQPFDENEDRVKAGVYEFHSPFWDHVSEDAKDLIRRLLVVDPSERLTARQALQHPWITMHDDVLTQRDLSSTQQQIQKFNARRRFRATVDAVVVANRWRNLLGGGKKGKSGAQGGEGKDEDGPGPSDFSTPTAH